MRLLGFNYQPKVVTYLGAKGNSGDMVKRLKIEIIRSESKIERRMFMYNTQIMKPHLYNLETIYVRFYYKGIKTDYYVNPCNRGVYSGITNKLLKPVKDRNGYIAYNIFIDNKRVYIGYHQMVALMFLPPPDDENKTEIDHLDCNKSNNDYRNLEWVTRAENVRRSFSNGCHKPRTGDNNNMVKYSDAQVIAVLQMLQAGNTIDQVHNITGMPKGYLYKLASGSTRADLYKHFTIPKSVLKRPIGKKASPEEIEKVKNLKASGYSMKEVSEKTSIPLNKVKLIWYYKHV